MKRTLSPGTGGNKVKTGMKPTQMALLAPQEEDTSSEVPASGRAGGLGPAGERAAGAAARLARECGPVASVSSPYFYLVGVFLHADLFPTWTRFQAKRLREGGSAALKGWLSERGERKRNNPGAKASSEADVTTAPRFSAASRVRALNTLRDASL